jgi:hypothetical protein
MELLLNGGGLQVDFEGTQGLFNKSAGRTGTLGSDPFDPDLMALI